MGCTTSRAAVSPTKGTLMQSSSSAGRMGSRASPLPAKPSPAFGHHAKPGSPVVYAVGASPLPDTRFQCLQGFRFMLSRPGWRLPSFASRVVALLWSAETDDARPGRYVDTSYHPPRPMDSLGFDVMGEGSPRTVDQSTTINSRSPTDTASRRNRRYESSRSATTGYSPHAATKGTREDSGGSERVVTPTVPAAIEVDTSKPAVSTASQPFAAPAFKRSATSGYSPKSSRQSGIRWRKGETIGRGAFGAVHLGLNDDTGSLMAVKELRFSYNDKKEIQNLQSEINLMR